MNVNKCRYILASVFLSLAGVGMNVNAEGTAIEWAPFIKAVGVTDEQLVAAAVVVNSDFLIKQKGFIKRELIKKDDNEYADVIYWESKADAITAGEKVSTCDKCSEYFKLMEMGTRAGEGFSHYIIVKSWKRQ